MKASSVDTTRGFSSPTVPCSQLPPWRKGSSTCCCSRISAASHGLSPPYFFLDELLASPRFSLFEKDGFSYLLSCPYRYDLILCDAFTGKKESSSLMSGDGIALLKAHLTENGIFMSNFITSLTGLHSRPGHTAKKLFESGFRNTSLIQADDTRDPSQLQNCILMASDGEL